VPPDAEEPCKFRFRDAPGSSPPPAPRWDQHELDRQISDLCTILAAQVVEFDKARDLAWIDITGVTQRDRFRLREAGPGRTIVTFRIAYHSDGGLLHPENQVRERHALSTAHDQLR